MRPYYDAGGITIYYGDAREILPGLEMTPDLILTDPPYGICLDTANKSRQRGFRMTSKGMSGDCKDWPRIEGDDKPFDPALLLGRTKNMILWGGNHYASRLPDSRCWMVWDRKDGRAGGTVTDAELAWTSGLPYSTNRIFRHVWSGWQRDSENAEPHLHPAQKPVKLMEWCLSFFPDAICVLDPYTGSGPVLRAAKNLGKRAIGIDSAEWCCEAAALRLSQEVMILPPRPVIPEAGS
jgi:site-specific DNA-methyltransferase (adenine-specific)/modification methylase